MFDCATLDQFLEEYGPALGEVSQQVLTPLHTPGKDHVDWLPDLLRPPFDAQCHVIAGGAKALNRQKGIWLICEMGTGKTIMGQAVAHTHACHQQAGRSARRTARLQGRAPRLGATQAPAYRGLIMCPPQLVAKWCREIRDTIPEARVYAIADWRDVVALDPTVPPTGPTWYVIGRETAKLSCTWKPACPARRLQLEGSKLHRRALALARAGKSKLAPHMKDYLDRCEELRSWTETADAQAGLRCPKCGQVQQDKEGLFRGDDWPKKARRKCEARVQAGDGRWVECGEQLWQDVARPRKYSPARFIKEKLPGYFDYFILDEAHEEKSPDSVQAAAVGWIAGAAKKVIFLTGTLVGGYAWHVRTLLYRSGLGHVLSRQGLGWKDETEFNERFGRIETRIVTRDGDGGGDDDATEVGHKTARGGTRTSKIRTVKPGIVPTLFGECLVDAAIFLQLEEISDALPELAEDVVAVDMDPMMASSYKRVEKELMDALKDMVRIGDKRLLSTMLQVLLCYPDYPFGWSSVGYMSKGDYVAVAFPDNYERDATYPKEEAVLAQVREELAEGRKCWIYTTFTDKRDCAGRLEERLAAEGIRVKAMRSTVPPEKREAWIAAWGPKVDVIISHPQLVQTGLDFFDKGYTYNFPTLLFYQTGYNLFTLMQASRRAWRIGQKKLCKVIYFYYKGTMQERAMILMGQKQTAANAVNGRFSSEGLTAMAGEDDNMEMALAKSIAERTTIGQGEGVRAWAKLTTAVAAANRPAQVADAGEVEDAMDMLARMREQFAQGGLFE